MAIQDFTAGQILTAAQMDSLQANDYNQTVSTKTVSYTLVAADKGTRVVMNAAGATTITVNTSVFDAGDTLFIQNIGAGTCTVTAGTATVTTSASLALAQWQGGTLYFTSASAAIFLPSNNTSAWQSYTPTFTNFTLGNGTATAEYIQLGKLVAVQFEVTFGSTSSMSTAPQISLPVTSSNFFVNAVPPLGWCSFADTGVNTFLGYVTQALTTTMTMFRPNVSGANIERGNVTATTPFTWGNTDSFAGILIYEAA